MSKKIIIFAPVIGSPFGWGERESGENPGQSRCCESSFTAQTNRSLRLSGRRLLPDDKPEDLPIDNGRLSASGIRRQGEKSKADG